MPKIKKEQLEHIQIDYGIVFANYGEQSQRRLGPTRGGATFDANQTVRDIEFDGRKGKTKGLQNIDFIDAVLKITTLAISDEDLELAMPYLKKETKEGGNTYICDEDSIGLITEDAYFKNITVFGKKTGGNYIKITLYNAMNEAAFSLAAVPKGEGTVNLEINGHWEETEGADIKKLFEITNVKSLEDAETGNNGE